VVGGKNKCEGELPERHVLDALVESGSIQVRAELLCKIVADVVALCAVAIADAKHGGVFYTGPHDVRVLIFFFSVFGFVAGLEERGQGRRQRAKREDRLSAWMLHNDVMIR
jgi:hypothetical protein